MIGDTLAGELSAAHERCAVGAITPATCTYEPVRSELRRCVDRSDGLLTLRDVGISVEGRALSTVTFGRGDQRILMWSQMHGDEPTATLATLDLLSYLVDQHSAEQVERLMRTVTVVVLPMLNPDGAERCQRVNAAQIDLNRDATMLATPEARSLYRVHADFSPTFAFNLHDQALSSVGDSTRVAAVSLLAPPFDSERSIDPTRQQALRLASYMSAVLSTLAGGHITRYADDYESRAFGDRMQSWGTSTVLVESGHWPGDPEKAFVRRLNFVGILSAIMALGDRSYEQTDLDSYLNLEDNGKRLFDLVVREITLVHPAGWSEKVDVGLMYEPRKMRDGTAWPLRGVVKAVGDLSTFGGLREIRGRGDIVDVQTVTIERTVDLADISQWGERET